VRDWRRRGRWWRYCPHRWGDPLPSLHVGRSRGELRGIGVWFPTDGGAVRVQGPCGELFHAVPGQACLPTAARGARGESPAWGVRARKLLGRGAPVVGRGELAHRRHMRRRRVCAAGARSAIWRKEEGGREACRGLRQIGKAEEFARGSEPPDDFGERDCDSRFYQVCWKGCFSIFSIFYRWKMI
jgi:hypothetical protein